MIYLGIMGTAPTEPFGQFYLWAEDDGNVKALSTEEHIERLEKFGFSQKPDPTVQGNQ